MLKAGVAKVVITPPIGTDMGGFLVRENPSIGVLDNVYARALVLSDEETTLGIVTADTLGFSPEDVHYLREEAHERFGLDNILFSAIHTHSGPAVMVLHGCGTQDPAYKETFRNSILQILEEAMDNQVPAQAGWGKGHCEIGVNRRLLWGSSKEGKTDPETGVLRIDDMQGSPLCTAVFYACHPVVMGPDGRKFTRDYPGFTVDTIESRIGGQALFFNGAMGDINPIATGSYAEAERLGKILAEEAIKVAQSIETTSDISLKGDQYLVHLPITPKITLGEGDFAGFENDEKYKKAMEEWQASVCNKGNVTHLTGEITLFNLGELTILGLPGEVFVETGLAIKEAFAPKPVFIAGYSSWNLGYIPTRKAVAEGGYEVTTAYRFYGQPGPFTEDAEGVLLGAVLTHK
jgi:hypothetical protein